MDSVPTDVELDSQKIKKIKANNLPRQDQDDIEPVSPADKLCEDELSLILSNASISTRDLFNFRLVNKSWCDAATSTLLRRDVSYVPLGVRRLPYEGDDDLHGSELKDKPLLWKLGIQTENTDNIKKLITVMSNSKRFPSSSFHLCIRAWAWKLDYRGSPSFNLFLELHGKTIQTLSAQGFLPLDFLFEVLLVYTPNLKRLDLSEAELFGAEVFYYYTNHLAASPSSLILKTLPIQSVFLDSSPLKGMSNKIVQELLSFPPKLTSIENVSVETFPLVLKEEKGSLIRSFLLSYDRSATDFIRHASVMEQLAGINPKLSTLTLDLWNTDFYSATLNSINEILNSSKDNLENLCINMGEVRPENKLKIPPMKNLKFIDVRGNPSYIRTVEMQNGLNLENLSFWELEDNVGAEQYFPNLLNVSLTFVNCEEDQDPVLSLFQFKPYKICTKICCEGRSRTWSSLPKVETLNIETVCWSHIWNVPFFHQVFPNIRILKTSWDWDSAKKFNSSFWAICPLVEVIEITDIPSVEIKNTSVIDSFFTGFPIGLCRKLVETKFPVHMNNPETWNFLRTKPSILDLQYLKEFKLSFKEIPCFEFASHLTRDFAFSHMPNTKFIIAYDQESAVSRRTALLASKPHDDENNDRESRSIGDDRSLSNKSGDGLSRSSRSRSCSSESGDDNNRSRSSRSCGSECGCGQTLSNGSRGSESGDDRSLHSRSCGSENGDDQNRGNESGDDQSRSGRSCGSENGDDQNRGNESGDDQSRSSRSCGSECGCGQNPSNESRGSESGDDRSRRSRSCGSDNGDSQNRDNEICDDRSRSSSIINYSSESDDDNKNGNDRNVDDVELCFAFLKPYVQIIQQRNIRYTFGID